MELLVSVGLMNSVMQQYPPHVQEGLNERMTATLRRTQQEIEIIHSFGEAFDE